MPEITTLGAASWVGHAGPDQAAAIEFYKDVIGWQIADMTVNGGPTIPGIQLEDGPIGGFSPIPEASASWTIYITVRDVDACVAKALKNGAELVYEAMDMPGVGRMATLLDPQGARFAVITYEQNG